MKKTDPNLSFSKNLDLSQQRSSSHRTKKKFGHQKKSSVVVLGDFGMATNLVTKWLLA